MICFPSLLGAAESWRANIVIVMVDDMGFSDLGCYGGDPTPNLDALAAAGVRCTQFYNTGRCRPTPASRLPLQRGFDRFYGVPEGGGFYLQLKPGRSSRWKASR